jgi:outer membrane protein
MFKPFAGLLLLLLLCPYFAGATVDTLDQLQMDIPRGQLTLDQAQRLALKNSPGITEAVARIEAAEAVVDQSRASLWPQLSLNAGYRLQNSTMQPDWAPEIRKEESFNNLTAGLQANWLLFDGFARKARILAAKYGSEAAEAGLQETRRLLADGVANAFYQAQLAAESMLIARNNQQFNKQLEADADKRWQVGTIPESEKLNFSVRALQAESDYLNAAQNFEVVSRVLAELLALPKAELPQQLYPVSATNKLNFKEIPDLDIELDYALKHRTDLQILKAQLAALTEQKNVKKGSYYPKVGLYGGVKYSDLNGVSTVDQEEHDSYLGLNLTWDLYTGGARPAQIREIDRNAAQIRHQLEQKILAVQSQIGQAGVRARQTYAMYQRHQTALQMTIRIRDHIEKSYRAGVTTLTRLNEAQRDLVQMAGRAIYSRINYQIALKDLDTASGRHLAELTD